MAECKEFGTKRGTAETVRGAFFARADSDGRHCVVSRGFDEGSFRGGGLGLWIRFTASRLCYWGCADEGCAPEIARERIFGDNASQIKFAYTRTGFLKAGRDP